MNLTVPSPTPHPREQHGIRPPAEFRGGRYIMRFGRQDHPAATAAAAVRSRGIQFAR